MLRIDRVNNTFSLLTSPSLADASITERYGLQEFIANSPAVFFRELGLELFLLGKEVLPSRTVQDRIDLLCVDKQGAIVIVELKRGSHKLQLLQSISYAAMISKWSADEILALLDDDKRESLTEFLETEVENVNHLQKIVLVAEAYDYAVLVSAEWLAEVKGIDISCCRIAIANDEVSGVEYLVCSNVYPTPELADEAVRRGRERVPGRVNYADWDVALEAIENPEVVTFFRSEVDAGTESNLQKRHLYFRHAAMVVGLDSECASTKEFFSDRSIEPTNETLCK